MAENIKHSHNQPPHGLGHETTDVNIWAVGKFGIALVIMTLLSIGLLIGVFNFFQAREDRHPGVVNPVTIFPKPQVLDNEPKGLAAFRASEQKEITGYGWVDQSKGIVRIPVDQAIDLLVKRGLPVRPQTAAASGVSMPTESGLGIAPKPHEEIRK